MSKLLAFPIAGLLFCVWAVYLGGLSAVQSQCNDNSDLGMPNVPGIDPTLPCSKTLRLYWFYMAFELFVIIAIAVSAVTGRVTSSSSAITGLLAVGLVLFIEASNTFLSAEDADAYQNGQPLHRIRTVTAGAIMVATANGLAMLGLGHSEPFGHHTTAEKPVSAV